MLHCLMCNTIYGVNEQLVFRLRRNNARNRKLWDKTDTKWRHDLYVAEEQGPKTKQELRVCTLTKMFNYTSLQLTRL